MQLIHWSIRCIWMCPFIHWSIRYGILNDRFDAMQLQWFSRGSTRFSLFCWSIFGSVRCSLFGLIQLIRCLDLFSEFVYLDRLDCARLFIAWIKVVYSTVGLMGLVQFTSLVHQFRLIGLCNCWLIRSVHGFIDIHSLAGLLIYLIRLLIDRLIWIHWLDWVVAFSYCLLESCTYRIAHWNHC